MLGVEEIMEILPHRDPFLLVDAITEIEPGKRAVGYKYVRPDEDFFRGHFPGAPVMPGVLIIESMAQVGAVAILIEPANRGKLPVFGGIDKVRLRRPVKPGDTLVTEATVLQSRSNSGKVHAVARVNGEVVAESECLFVLVSRDRLEHT